MCVACRKEPGSRGCLQVNTVYKLKDNELIVEHTQKTKEPVVFLHDDEQNVAKQDEPDTVEQTISVMGPAELSVNVSSDKGHMEYDNIKG